MKEMKDPNGFKNCIWWLGTSLYNLSFSLIYSAFLTISKIL